MDGVGWVKGVFYNVVDQRVSPYRMALYWSTALYINKHEYWHLTLATGDVSF